MAVRRIGFVGLGNMGWPMASHLARGGFELTVYDLRIERAAEFASTHGATHASSAAEVAARSECIVTMLPDHFAVRAAILGDGKDAAAAALEAGHVVVDMGTSDPHATRSLGAALSLRGVQVIDAPVMGGVPFAREASLDILAAGDGETIDLLEPMLLAMGRKVYRCGALGAAHALKAINNYINACALINVIEGLAIGAKLGIDTAIMVETMQAMCTGRNHPIDKKIVPQVLTRRYATGMPIGFIAKDLRIAVEAAQRAGAAAPLAEKVLNLWQAAGEALGASCDQSEIVRYWEQESGVRIA